MEINTFLAIAISALLLVGGCIGGAYVFPNEITETVEVEKLVNVTVEVVDTEAVDTLTAELEDYKSYDETIADIKEDAAMTVEAEDYLDRKDHLIVDFMNSEYNLTIEDEEDISITFEDIDVTADDRDDGEFTIDFELKVKYFEDGDKDLDGHAHIIATVVIEEGDAEEISFVDNQ